MAVNYCRVYLGFGSTWQTEDASITWTEVTCYVRKAEGVGIKRGATSAYGLSGAGEFSFSLNNRDRRFDPLHTTGPHYGDLVSGVPCRVDYADGAEVEAIARGFVKSWPQVSFGPTWSVVPIECIDGFHNLSLAPVPESVYDVQVASEDVVGHWKLTDPGNTAADSSGNGYDGTYRNDPALSGVDAGLLFGKPAHEFNGINQAVDIPDHAARLGLEVGQVATVVAAFRTSATAASGQYDTIYNQGGDHSQDWVRLNIGDDGCIYFEWYAGGTGTKCVRTDGTFNDGETHFVIAEVFRFDSSTSFESIYVDGVAVGTSTSSQGTNNQSAIVIGGHPNPRNSRDYFDGFLSHVSTYYGSGLSDPAGHYAAAMAPLDGQTIDERAAWLLDQIDWPSDLRDFQTGKTILGPAYFGEGERALAYLRLLEQTEDGRLFISRDGKLTIHDRHFPWTAAVATVSQFTFSDDPADNAAYAEFTYDTTSPDFVTNAYRYSRRGGGEVRGQDDTSIDAYGFREDQQSDLLVGTDNEVRARGQWALLTRAQPLPQIKSIRVPVHRYTAADAADIMGLDLGHRVTARRTPQGEGAQIDLDFIVSGIRIDAAYAELWAELYVAPAVADDVDLFTLGSSVLDGSDVLAY